jgi:hypothetical protein
MDRGSFRVGVLAERGSTITLRRETIGEFFAIHVRAVEARSRIPGAISVGVRVQIPEFIWCYLLRWISGA